MVRGREARLSLLLWTRSGSGRQTDAGDLGVDRRGGPRLRRRRDTGRAMSHENVEVVRRVTDVMDAEGFGAALPVFLEAAHSDVEWREDPAWPDSATYRGVDQVRQVIRDRMDTLDFDQQTEDL